MKKYLLAIAVSLGFITGQCKADEVSVVLALSKAKTKCLEMPKEEEPQFSWWKTPIIVKQENPYWDLRKTAISQNKMLVIFLGIREEKSSEYLSLYSEDLSFYGVKEKGMIVAKYDGNDLTGMYYREKETNKYRTIDLVRTSFTPVIPMLWQQPQPIMDFMPMIPMMNSGSGGRSC